MEELSNTMNNTVEHPSHVTKKRTMMKDRVGCVRSTTYNLPPESHVYGKKSGGNDEGSAELISNWVTSNPSLEKKSEKMLVHSNILAIKRGCITSKGMRDYALAHPNIRMKESLLTDFSTSSNMHEGPFGIKSHQMAETMADIIQARFTSYENDDADYPRVDSIKKVGSLPVPRSTVASNSVAHARNIMAKREEEANKPPFIMKKFRNVKGSMQREREERAKLNAVDNRY